MRAALLALLLAVPVQAATPAPAPDVRCDGKWCAVKQETLRALIENAKKLSDDTRQLRALCGWERK